LTAKIGRGSHHRNEEHTCLKDLLILGLGSNLLDHSECQSICVNGFSLQNDKEKIGPMMIAHTQAGVKYWSSSSGSKQSTIRYKIGVTCNIKAYDNMDQA
jgi:hypothetical protein